MALIPAMLVVPILTWLLGSFVTLTAFLFQAAQNLMFAVLTIIVTVSAVLAFAYILKLLWKMHVESRRRNAWRR